MRVVLLAALVLLSGCSGGTPASEGSDAIDVGAAPAAGMSPLSGWIFDAAIAPVVEATVSIPALGIEATTDDEGHYGLDDVPVDEVIVVVAEADGFRPSSKSISLSPDTFTLLNFTLEPLPTKSVYHMTQSFKGMIACSTVVKSPAGASYHECGDSMPANDRVWEFIVDPDLKGVIIEVVWEQNTPVSDHLNITVETVDFGEFDEVLATAEGPNVLRAQVNRFQAERFYKPGGTLRVSVDPGRDTADAEVSAGVGSHVQQNFEIYATAFYVEPPPVDFSIVSS